MKGLHKILAVSMVLLFAIGSAAAKVSTRPFVSATLCGVLCHATADYLNEYPGDPSVEMPFFRTSFMFGFDAVPLDLKIGSVDVGFGISYVDVSTSIAFGTSVLKPYNGVGLVSTVRYDINGLFSIAVSGRYLFCVFTGSESRFNAVEAEVLPVFKVLGRYASMSVGVPLAFSYKVDAISFRSGVTLVLALDSAAFGGGK